jgi:enoyl-CoA hydratase
VSGLPPVRMLDAGLEITTRGRVAVVRIDRPPVNALSGALYEAIRVTFDELGDPATGVQAAILTGSGRYFSAGRDVKSAGGEDPERRFAAIADANRALHRCAIPVIAAVNGPALGGGFGLVLSCDIIVAAEEATFGWPEINFGLTGGMALSRRTLNPYVSRRLFFTGDTLSADELHGLHVVDRIVPFDALDAAALELADRIAAKSPLALRAAKWTANEVEGFLDHEQAFRAVESRVSMALAQTEDHQEAVRAFREKRAPRFEGR